MSYTSKTISEVVSEFLNHNTFLPAIQREFVWEPDGIEKLLDSIMGDYPISTFLFWKIREEHKGQWTAYEFIRNFDKEEPHNTEANLSGINQDIYLVLDGQQRLTSLFIALKGSYRYFYYRWYTTRLYLNILKKGERSENPEELAYEFKFRENDQVNSRDPSPQFWYPVGDILNYGDAEDAKKSVKNLLSHLPEEQRDTAFTNIGRLHSRIHTMRILNYYEERSQDYDKVVEIFIRINTGGTKLEYSDILLSTATAKWNTLNARDEIHNFTDHINSIGNGYTFGKDFVLKGALYLTEGLPIQYRIGNFTRKNLEKIEDNWSVIKDSAEKSVKLASKFGLNDKNITAKIALLPIALYLKRQNKKNFLESTHHLDVKNQVIIQKWLVIALLKTAFGSSSDTTLRSLQEVIEGQPDDSIFPYQEINRKLNIETSFNDTEIDNFLNTSYGTKYSYLLLSLLYPDRDWKDNKYHEDHVFPKSEFTTAKLKQRGYDENRISDFQKYHNCIINLQLLTDSENLEKSSSPFDEWFTSRDGNFKERHKIPTLESYNFDHFIEFAEARKVLIKEELKNISFA